MNEGRRLYIGDLAVEADSGRYSRIWQITNGDQHDFDIHPRYLVMPTARLEDLKGGDPAHNAGVLRRTLSLSIG